MDSLCLHGAIRPSGVQLVGWLHPGRSVPARHVSHARVSGVFLGCYAAGNECVRRYFEMSWLIAWSAGSGPRGASEARKPLPARRSGSCHVHVTVETLGLEITRPIVVLFWHTDPVSAYRKVEPGPGQGAATGGTLYSGQSGKRLPD